MKYSFLKRILAALFIFAFSTGANYLTLCLMSWEMNPQMWPGWVRVVGAAMIAVSFGAGITYLLPGNVLDPQPEPVPDTANPQPITMTPEQIEREKHIERLQESNERISEATDSLIRAGMNLTKSIASEAARQPVKKTVPKTSRRKKR